MVDILYCSAGGCRTECGFVNEIEADDLESCMRNNYFTSAYTAQSILKIWERDDQKSKSTTQKLRQIVFINSGLVFIPIPGYGAYTGTLNIVSTFWPRLNYLASKCAVRGLADTLRIEAHRLTCSASRYTIHCAFPSNFISPAFIQEQE
jgi:3-dehydrosphinganine reductase